MLDRPRSEGQTVVAGEGGACSLPEVWGGVRWCGGTEPPRAPLTPEVHHAPYNPHPTPYTLHPTPYTPHPAPYTLHHAPRRPFRLEFSDTKVYEPYTRARRWRVPAWQCASRSSPTPRATSRRPPHRTRRRTPLKLEMKLYGTALPQLVPPCLRRQRRARSALPPYTPHPQP